MKPPQAPPRIQAYLEHAKDISAFATPRTQWESLGVDSTRMVAIDVAMTPLRSIGQVASTIAIVASQTSTGGGRVSVYRHDPRDEPTPINVDHYSVWTDLAAHPDLPKLVTAASTSLNLNLLRYIRHTVFWVKEKPGADHWLTEVPSSVIAAVTIEASSPADLDE